MTSCWPSEHGHREDIAGKNAPDWGAKTGTTYDELDRVSRVTSPDGSIDRLCYTNNEVVSRDAAGVWYKRVPDALGRVKNVFESPTASCDGQSNLQPLNLLTAYQYDARGNLSQVNQGAQQRSFVYDSLNRLLSATNPETGTITYSYDPSGNLVAKSEPRGTTTLSYDVRGRIKSKLYSDTTPAVTYCYDGDVSGACSGAPSDSSQATINSLNLKGRLTMVTSTASTTKYSAYDAHGRVLASSQTIAGATDPYNFRYSYNDVAHTSMALPSGRVVTTSYDGAGRIAAVTGTEGYATPRPYVTDATYEAHGGLRQMRLGGAPESGGRIQQICYNARLQSTVVRLGNTAPFGCASDGSELLRLDFGYPGGANNGNLASQIITTKRTNGGYLSLLNSYTYDGLNRFRRVDEMVAGGLIGGETGGNWSLTYGYDQYGNAYVDSPTTAGIVSNTMPTSAASYYASNNKMVAGAMTKLAT